jgi:hypothetical protein
VEVVLALAISTLLIATVLTGRNSVRSQAQFSDGMERIKETILSVKNEANTGNNTIGRGVAKPSPTSPNNYLTIGRSIHFTTDSASADRYDTKTLLCNTSAASGYACLGQVSFPPEANNVSSVPWGITYTGYTVNNQPGPVENTHMTLIFVRDDKTGAFKGYWYAGEVTRGMPQATAFANQSVVTLNFESPDGRKGTVTVDPVSGVVTRQVL